VTSSATSNQTLNSTETHAPGTPIWTDLGSPDVQASARFYGQLFGWQAEDLGEQAGHYNMFRHNGKVVAAAGPLMNPGQPTAWTTYVSVSNAEATAKKVTEAGGTVLSAPMAIMDQGSMAVFADPAGAAFAIWQPAVMKGAEQFNTPVSMSWNELATRDVEGAKAFYAKVFGWGVKSNPMPGGGEYIEWQLNGKSIGGGQAMGSRFPPQVPPHWLVYFAVANTDETMKRAQELGGKVMSPAIDIPQGRLAVIADPQGATFAVIQNAR
jgi:predicted enzyme related to lactoylglutathione lyase